MRGRGLKLPPVAANDTASAVPALSLCEVTKRYSGGSGTMPAVRGVSLDVAAGQLTAIIGPSGSGKTTLLSMMGAILRPSSGRVVIDGDDVSDMAEEERSRVRLARIGFIFQHYNLFPALTARQNVEIALDLKGVPRRARREQALDLLGRLRLAERSDAYPADLSGGEKQRVAIARALAGAPRIILADEPTAALDSSNGGVIMTILRDLAKHERRAIVLVTHDSRILDFVDRVIRVEDGVIVGDTDARRDSPALPASLTSALIRRPSLVEPAVT